MSTETRHTPHQARTPTLILPPPTGNEDCVCVCPQTPHWAGIPLRAEDLTSLQAGLPPPSRPGPLRARTRCWFTFLFLISEQIAELLSFVKNRSCCFRSFSLVESKALLLSPLFCILVVDRRWSQENDFSHHPGKESALSSLENTQLLRLGFLVTWERHKTKECVTKVRGMSFSVLVWCLTHFELIGTACERLDNKPGKPAWR